MADIVSKRSIVYEILTDFSKSKTDAKEAVQTFEKFGNELEKNVNQSKSLTAQLRELKKQLGSDNISAEQFTKLSIEAAKLEDRIGNINQRVRNLASETKTLDAFISIATGIAGGFAAAQGAVALFGNENKNLEKALLKVQASLAVLNGLQQVQATVLKESAAKTFIVTNAQKVYKFVVEGATTATKLLNAALVASVGGAIIYGLTQLASKMNLFGDETKNAKKEAKDLNDELERMGKIQVERLNTSINKFKSTAGLAVLSTQEITSEISRLKEEIDKIPREGLTFIVNGQQVKQDVEKAKTTYLNEISKLEQELERRKPKLALTPFQLGDVQDGSLEQPLKSSIGLVGDLQQKISDLESQVPFAKTQEQLDSLRIQIVAAKEDLDKLLNPTVDKEGLNIALDTGNKLLEKRLELTSLIAGVGFQLLDMQFANSKASNALAVSEILFNQGVAVSKAIASAKGVTGIDYAIQVALAVGSAVSAFAQIHQILSQAKSAQANAESQRSAVAFAEGTPYAELNGNPKGVDTIPARINEGERIIPTDQNMQHWDILEAIRKNNLDDYINLNYVSPSLAMEAVKAAEKDSMIDYSNRFYRQYLATNEGNEINKKAIRVLSSIDRKIKTAFPKEYS